MKGAHRALLRTSHKSHEAICDADRAGTGEKSHFDICFAL